MNYVDEIIKGGYNDIGRLERKTISIYNGGKKYYRTVNEECCFHLRDILISSKYIDLEDEKNRWTKISGIFRLDGTDEEDVINEIKYLLSLTDKELAQIYVKRFNLFSVFSTAVHPLFDEIKKYYVEQIEKMDNNEQLLNQLNGIKYCSYEPVVRMKRLLDFPIDEKDTEIMNKLELDKIQTIDPPYPIVKLPDKNTVSVEDLSDEEIEECIKRLICKLDSSRILLRQWELYYISYSKVFSSLSEKFDSVKIE